MKAWKDIIIALVLVMGAWLIGCVMGRHHFREATKMLQRDTTYVYDTIRYSRLNLASNTYELDIPKIDKAEMVFIPESSTTIIYRDSIRYVTLPREYFYTETDDVQIWHSGIQSTIDSLNVFRKSTTIRESIKEKRNSISIGVESNYSNGLNLPIQVQYSRHIRPWFSVYGYAEYELIRGCYGVGIGTQISIGW